MMQLWRTSHIFRFIIANTLLIGAGALSIYYTTAFLWVLAFLAAALYGFAMWLLTENMP